MKIYTVMFDMTQVHGRLTKFNLYEFNHEFPELFIEAENPDDACYLSYCKFSETLMRQSSSKETAELFQQIMHDIRITKVACKDEKRS